MSNNTTRLFKGGSDWRYNACVGHNGGLLGFCSMGNGYYRSAELLSKHIVNTGFEMDLLIYPIVFSYRHGMELFLKGFLVKIRTANGDSTNNFFNHYLSDKWKEIRQFIVSNKFDNKDDDENIFLTEIIDDVIDDFSEYDPNSFHFRYHISKSGSINQEDVKLINIKDLKIRMDKVFRIFNFWWECLDNIDD